MSATDNILVTGFGPFGEHKVNASWESVKLLPDTIEGFQIIKEEIPVSYVYVEDTVPKLWKVHAPKLVVHVGVSSFTNKLTIETCAHREGYHRVDCSNAIKQKVCSSGDGTDCLVAEINIQEICSYINNTNLLKAQSSENAGRYLCEFIYYTSLNIDRRRTLFVHVPPIDKPYPVEILAEGLKEVIRSALKQLLLGHC